MSDWGQGAKNNDIGWGQGAVNNDISWGAVHADSWAGDTEIVGSTPLLLDTYPGAAAAYSLRQLSSTTTNVVRVRRSSDNAEQDFTATQITDETLITFCGVGDGFVTTWYDQSGNSRNVTQTLASRQPKIVQSGSVIQEGGKPSIKGLNLSRLQANFTLSSPTTIFSVSTKDTINTDQAMYDGFNDVNYLIWGISSLSAVSTGGVMEIISGEYSGTKIISVRTVSGNNGFNLNGVSSAVNTSTGIRTANGITIFDIRGNTIPVGNGFNWLGKIQEIIVYPSDQTINQNNIDTEINNHYNIY